MRAVLLTATAFITFAATLTFETRDANALVCARGVRGAGCAAVRGPVVRAPVARAVVVTPTVVTPVVVVAPVARCRTVIVRGVAVRKCV